MKKIILSIALIVGAFFVTNAQVGQGLTTPPEVIDGSGDPVGSPPLGINLYQDLVSGQLWTWDGTEWSNSSLRDTLMTLGYADDTLTISDGGIIRKIEIKAGNDEVGLVASANTFTDVFEFIDPKLKAYKDIMNDNPRAYLTTRVLTGSTLADVQSKFPSLTQINVIDTEGNTESTLSTGADAIPVGLFTISYNQFSTQMVMRRLILEIPIINAQDSIWQEGDTTFFKNFDGDELDTLIASKGFPVDTTGFASFSSPRVSFNSAGDTIIAVESTALNAIPLNSESAVVSLTLASSNGLGATNFYINDSVATNQASITVQSGETLNGVVDGTFYFSSYSNGTEFIATEVSGGWIVSVVGASVDGESPSYLMDVTDITASGTTIVLGTNPASGQTAIHNDGTATITRIGDKAVCTMRLTTDDDDLFNIILGTSIVPTGGKILSVATSSPTLNENSDIMIRRNNINTNQILVNRADAMDADTDFELVFVTDGWGELNPQILAGMVTPESIYHTRFSLSADANSIVCPFDEEQGDLGIFTNTGGTITLPVGKYRIQSHATRNGAVLDYELYNVTTSQVLERYTVFGTDVSSNGSNMPYYLTVTTPTQIQIREGDAGISVQWNGRQSGNDAGFDDAQPSYGTWLDIQMLQKGQFAMINSTDTPVNDQASSGYFETGNKIEQWGNSTSTGTTPHTVTFPVAFPNTSYSVVCKTIGGGNGQTISIQSKSTTGFTVTTVDVNGTPQNNNFDWQAIGLKPN